MMFAPVIAGAANSTLSGEVMTTLSGTASNGLTESEVVDGGKTIVIELTGDTWVASGSTFDNQRQNIIDGLDSNKSEATGWNAEVRDKLSTSAVVRTSDTVVTITLSAAASYDITQKETVTATVPGSALVSSSNPVEAGSFEITPEGGPPHAGFGFGLGLRL